MKFRKLSLFALAACAALSHGQASFTGDYTENFDHLAHDDTGTSISFATASAVPGTNGWFLSQDIESDILSTTDGGSKLTAGLQSIGAAGSDERALGYANKGRSNPGIFGLALANDTGRTLTSLDISFDSEVWRDALKVGSLDNTNAVLVGYRIGGTSVKDGDVTNLPLFTLKSGTGSTVRGLNGNVNRTTLSGTVSGFSLAAGQTFWLTFAAQAQPSTSSDPALLGVDNVSIHAQAVPEPTTWAVMGLGTVAMVRRRRR